MSPAVQAPELVVPAPPAEQRNSVALECPACAQTTSHLLGSVLGEFPLTTLRRVDCTVCARARLWWDDEYNHPGRIWGLAPYSPSPKPLDADGLHERAAQEFPGAQVVWLLADRQCIGLQFPGGQDAVHWTVGEQSILCTARDAQAWMEYAATLPYQESGA